MYLNFSLEQFDVSISSSSKVKYALLDCYGPRGHRSVFNSSWMSPDRRCAVGLANWTSEGQKLRVRESRLGGKISIHTSAGEITKETISLNGKCADVTLPPLSIAILEGHMVLPTGGG